MPSAFLRIRIPRFSIIKNKKLKIPEDDIDAFTILLDNSIIDKNLAIKLKNAKKMRNIIAHLYGNVDDELVFEAITEKLEKDVQDFIHVPVCSHSAFAPFSAPRRASSPLRQGPRRG